MKTMAEFRRDRAEFLADCLKAGLAKKLPAENVTQRLRDMVDEGNPLIQRAVQTAVDTDKPRTNIRNSVWDGTWRAPRNLGDGPENLDYFSKAPTHAGGVTAGDRDDPTI